MQQPYRIVYNNAVLPGCFSISWYSLTLGPRERLEDFRVVPRPCIVRGQKENTSFSYRGSREGSREEERRPKIFLLSASTCRRCSDRDWAHQPNSPGGVSCRWASGQTTGRGSACHFFPLAPRSPKPGQPAGPVGLPFPAGRRAGEAPLHRAAQPEARRRVRES